MGQKVGGYRRNVPYGKETLRRGGGRDGGNPSWRLEVNPKGRAGWTQGTSGRTETTYGGSLTEGRRLRQDLEEGRRAQGGRSNGFGRKGTKERGYEVYGEYTYEDPRPQGNLGNPVGGKEGETQGGKKKKAGKPRFSETSLGVARDRVRRKHQAQTKVHLGRSRRNLKERRKERGLEGEKKERRSVLGSGTKRLHPTGRAEAVALSGSLPTGQRRTNLLIAELEAGVNHLEVRRNRENRRSHQGKHPVYGRKRPEAKGGPRGYYGLQLRVNGPLGGARRTMTYRIQKGTVPRGTKKARRRGASGHAKTKIGTLGVKLVYCYGRG